MTKRQCLREGLARGLRMIRRVGAEQERKREEGLWMEAPTVEVSLAVDAHTSRAPDVLLLSYIIKKAGS